MKHYITIKNNSYTENDIYSMQGIKKQDTLAYVFM